MFFSTNIYIYNLNTAIDTKKVLETFSGESVSEKWKLSSFDKLASWMGGYCELLQTKNRDPDKATRPLQQQEGGTRECAASKS